jgi:hypothetical protein
MTRTPFDPEHSFARCALAPIFPGLAAAPALAGRGAPENASMKRSGKSWLVELRPRSNVRAAVAPAPSGAYLARSGDDRAYDLPPIRRGDGRVAR